MKSTPSNRQEEARELRAYNTCPDERDRAIRAALASAPRSSSWQKPAPQAGMRLPSSEDLRSLLEYDPETGLMIWKERGPEWFEDGKRLSAEGMCAIWNAKFSGKRAFCLTMKTGYHTGTILGFKALAHRVIWKMETGQEPQTIDHIDGNPSNNRIKNLRAASPFMQSHNKRTGRRNRSGCMGVSEYQPGRWKASIIYNRQSLYLGSFRDFHDAVAARKKAEHDLGFHQNHGGQAGKVARTI